MTSFIAAVIQLNSTSDEGANLDLAADLITRAAGHGASIVATPENTNFLGPHAEKARRAETLAGAVCQRFAELAQRLRIHLLLGSFNERSADPGKCHNTSVLFGPDGSILGVYRKLHLFDVDISPSARFRESETVVRGTEVVVVEAALGQLGLSICYDLRFAELYAELRRRGAEVLCIPSAFTLTTGKDHWEPLLRARAIETQCYVVAPAQWGRHDDSGSRESWGHAMIVDPWGDVVAMASDGTGLALAEIDPERVRRVRRAIPVAEHRNLGG
ncbi:MAG: carbon-nitrogen hydrolase family protein [Acidobacteriota bacterium]|nr:carbon-nitrogen hydrolase family protein [Acidobacteriota bacterium]